MRFKRWVKVQRWQVSLILSAVLSLGGSVQADPSSPPVDDETFEQYKRMVRESTKGTPQWYWFLKPQVVFPQRVAVAATAMRVMHPEAIDCRRVCAFNGWTASIKPGWGGSQAGVGYGWARGKTAGASKWVRSVYVAYGVQVMWLRTGTEAWEVRERGSYVGVEGTFTIVQVNMTAGFARRVSSSGSDDWVFTGGFGWGF